MELRSFNVERVYNDCVICTIGEDLGVRKLPLSENTENIKSMIKQIATVGGEVPLFLANLRKDGEMWTPYLQIVEMLIRLGHKIGVIEYTGPLKRDTVIKILYERL